MEKQNNDFIFEEPEMISEDKLKNGYNYDPIEGHEILYKNSIFTRENGYLVRYLLYDKDYDLTTDREKAVYYKKSIYIGDKVESELGVIAKKL